jgi:cobalamin biosynthesis protein CbiD
MIDACKDANTAMEVLTHAQKANLPLADAVANRALGAARDVGGDQTEMEVVIFDRQGRLAGRSHG